MYALKHTFKFEYIRLKDSQSGWFCLEVVVRFEQILFALCKVNFCTRLYPAGGNSVQAM